LLRRQGLSFECHLIGDGPLLEELKRQVEQSGLDDYVRFRGRLTREQIAQSLRQADVLVAPSVPTKEGRREGIPVVLMEAMASGLPVVSSNISGIPELVTHGESGILVAPRDAQALADALEQLHQQPALRDRLGQAGVAKVTHEFDLQANASALAHLFSAAPDGPRRARRTAQGPRGLHRAEARRCFPEAD
jgi:glycosyltransferase involved in cell wall biosynthesis